MRTGALTAAAGSTHTSTYPPNRPLRHGICRYDLASGYNNDIFRVTGEPKVGHMLRMGT